MLTKRCKGNLALIKCKPVIDVRTLEVWPSQSAVAQELGVTNSHVSQAIAIGGKVRGRRLEDLAYWRGLDAKDKEKMSISQFYFL